MARLILDRADALIALCQVTLESRDRGVGVGELLRDRSRLLERRKRRGEFRDSSLISTRNEVTASRFGLES